MLENNPHSQFFSHFLSQAASTSSSSSNPSNPNQPAATLAAPKVGLRVSFKDRIKALQSGTSPAPAIESKADPSPTPPTCKPTSLMVEAVANPAENMKEQLIPATNTPAPSIMPAALINKSTKPSLKDKIKSLSGQAAKEEPLKPWSKLKLATVVSGGGSYTSLNNSFNEDSPTGIGPPTNSTGSKSSFSDHTNSNKSTGDEKTLKGIMKRGQSAVAAAAGQRKIQSTTELERIKHKKPVRPAELTSVSDSEQSLSSSKSFLKRSQKEHDKDSHSKASSTSLKRRPKNYRSVDDLSPEYSGLPFVKKLKILNERQKLAELEHVIQTRSFSLDCPESIVQQTIYSGGTLVPSGHAAAQNSAYQAAQFDPSEPLTRSQSDASGMAMGPQKYSLKHHKLFQRPRPIDTLPPVHQYVHQPPSAYFQPHSPLSPESNETTERKHLKSILKRLSEDQQTQRPNHAQQQHGNSSVQELMRAPTVEGYVARHSKLLKSVTFNNTISSPPPIQATTTHTGQTVATAAAAATTTTTSATGIVDGNRGINLIPQNSSPSAFFADLYDPVATVIEDIPNRPPGPAQLHTSATTMTTTETTVITSTTVINNSNQVNGQDRIEFGPPAKFEELQLSEKIREEQLIRDSEHEPMIAEYPIKSKLSNKQKKLVKGKGGAFELTSTCAEIVLIIIYPALSV